MRHFSGLFLGIFSATILFCNSAQDVSAQPVLQLPTFRVFGTNSTVVVPDGGTAFLGGSTSAYHGSNQFGTPGFGATPFLGPLGQNRGFGGGGSTGSVSVSAWIHDQEAMDTAVLGAKVEEFQRNVRRDQALNSQLSQNRTQVAIPLTMQRNGVQGNSDSQRSNSEPLVLRSSTMDQGPLLSIAEIKRRKAIEQLQKSQQELSQRKNTSAILNRR